MKFDPSLVPTGKFIWEHYPLLGRRKVLSTVPDSYDWNLRELDSLIRYVLYFADPESPLADETDYEFRIEQAKELSRVKGKIVEEIDKEGMLFQSILLEVFKLANSYLYELWFSLKANYHILNTELRRHPDSLDSAALNARRMLGSSMEENLTALAKTELALFPNPAVEKIVNRAAMSEDPGRWVEEFAEELEWKDNE